MDIQGKQFELDECNRKNDCSIGSDRIQSGVDITQWKRSRLDDNVVWADDKWE